MQLIKDRKKSEKTGKSCFQKQFESDKLYVANHSSTVFASLQNTYREYALTNGYSQVTNSFSDVRESKREREIGGETPRDATTVDG